MGQDLHSRQSKVSAVFDNAYEDLGFEPTSYKDALNRKSQKYFYTPAKLLNPLCSMQYMAKASG